MVRSRFRRSFGLQEFGLASWFEASKRWLFVRGERSHAFRRTDVPRGDGGPRAGKGWNAGAAPSRERGGMRGLRSPRIDGNTVLVAPGRIRAVARARGERPLLFGEHAATLPYRDVHRRHGEPLPRCARRGGIVPGAVASGDGAWRWFGGGDATGLATSESPGTSDSTSNMRGDVETSAASTVLYTMLGGRRGRPPHDRGR